MKKLTTLITAIVVAAMGLCPIALQLKNGSTPAKAMQPLASITTTETNTVSPRSNKYLLSPTLIVQSESATFVFDSETNEIKAIENEKIVMHQSTQAQNPPLAMQFIAGHLFVLTQNAVSCFSYTPATETSDAVLTPVEITTEQDSQPTTQGYTFSAAISTFNIIKQAESENIYEMFVQMSGGSNLEIYKMILTYHEFEQKFSLADSSASFTSAKLADQQSNPSGKITNFAIQRTATGYKVVASDNTKTYALTCSSTNPISCELLDESACNSICTLGNLFACAKSESIEFFNLEFEKQQNSTILTTATKIASNESVLVSTNAQQQTVKQLLPQQTTLFQNQQITPALNLQNLQFGATQEAPQILLSQPYSTNGTIVSAYQSLIVLSSNGEGYLGLSYVTFASEGKNLYGYLPTEQIDILVSQQKSSSAKTIVSAKLYSLPSNITDETNTIVCDLSKGENITIISDAANITNNGSKFVQAQTKNGKIGYIELAKTVSTVSTPTLKQQKTNATAKCNTAIFASKSTNEQLITIEKGTRIQIKGLLNPTQKYTRVSLESENGTITGYMLTSDISSDSITTLQLIGIILLCGNAIFLAFSTAFLVAAKRKQQKIK